MSAHEMCGRPGKFDCAADEVVSTLANEDGAGHGSVEAPVGWFSDLDLWDNDPAEMELARHYDARYLIAREDNLGRFWVEVFVLRADRDRRLDDLQDEYERWAGAWL